MLCSELKVFQVGDRRKSFAGAHHSLRTDDGGPDNIAAAVNGAQCDIAVYRMLS